MRKETNAINAGNIGLQSGLAGDDCGGAPAQQSATERPDSAALAVLDELLKGLRETQGYQNERIYKLEQKIDRYERAFETMFREELNKRVGPDPKERGYAGEALRMDPLWAAEKALEGLKRG